MKFQKGSVCDVTYTDRFVFTKAKRLLPNPNEERWILDPNPTHVQEVNVSIDPGDGISLYASSIPQASQETMLVQDPNSPADYSFAPPTDLPYPSSLAMNGVADDGKNVDIAFGFFQPKIQQPELTPAQILCFHKIPQYTPVSLEFVPLLQAYFVPEDYYCEGEVLTMPIPSPLALQVDIRSLSNKQTKYTISIDSHNRAIIKP
ncbi:hypothetical protein PILCRDRAFT_219898 [Piloderma croceum F 1598]|uniref:Uncharacterized protein n=1 Tax=Piloderma croceum (strain F 1598) TaxID=765440 RepID=A0A0C3CHM4_PILCF|nr:hypothetical protein PILCRDRAFT_219898 [Piloderma croceum F 1598]